MSGSDIVRDLPNRPRPAPSRDDWLTTAYTGLLGLAVILFLTRYNMGRSPAWTSEPFRWRTWEEFLLVNCTGLLFLPLLLSLGILRQRPEATGFAPAQRGGGKVALVLFFCMLPILAVASRFGLFYNYYPMQGLAGLSWSYLIYYELTYGFYFFCWEYFYRGFLTFGLARALGPLWAILLQSIGFGVMHIGKPMPEMVSSFFGGFILGWLAWRSRSFYPCFALHWGISATFDLLTILARPGGIF